LAQRDRPRRSEQITVDGSVAVEVKALSPAEDAELRRLAALAAFGRLGDAAAALYDELRARDRRSEIREPADIVIPRQSVTMDR
jgi:hypothetical protein